jgi:hypothetical protein
MRRQLFPVRVIRVLVDRSRALLQAQAEQPEDIVQADQIALKIPQQLLDQAVLISRLRAESSPWRIVQPERQKVTPAVVSLATRTTVISEDGSWRKSSSAAGGERGSPVSACAASGRGSAFVLPCGRTPQPDCAAAGRSAAATVDSLAAVRCRGSRVSG